MPADASGTPSQDLWPAGPDSSVTDDRTDDHADGPVIGLRSPGRSLSPLSPAVVIGGGTAGLLAARRLCEAGCRVSVLEASARLGGAVSAHQLAGLTLDAGAESFATRTDAVPRLLHELGLSARVLAPEPRGSWLQLPEAALPMPSSGILGIPADPLDESLRPALSESGRLRAAQDAELPAEIGADAHTLGQVVRARMGEELLERLVAPVTLGVHSLHPDHLELATVAPKLLSALAEYGSLGAAAAHLRVTAPAGSQVLGLEGGMNLLTRTLAEQLERSGAELRTRAPVTALERTEQGAWKVHLDAETVPLEARTLVLAADAPEATRLMAPHLQQVGLSEESTGQQLQSGPEVALVTLVLQAPSLDQAPRGTGVLVSDQVHEVRAKALTHASAKWSWIARAAGPGRHVVRLSYGRSTAGSSGEQIPAQDPCLKLSDERLIRQGLHDAQMLLGTPLPEPIDADVIRWRGAIPAASPGHALAARAFRAGLAQLPHPECPALAVGSWAGGTGLASIIPDTEAHLAQRLGAALAASSP